MASDERPSRPGHLPPEAALFQVLFGYSRTQLIYASAKLGIADLLQDGPRSAAELAHATATHEDTLRRVMRGLVNMGIFAEDEGRYALTPVGACLRSGVPNSLRGWALLTGEVLYDAWGGLLHSLRTGETAFNHIYGMGVYEYLAAHPDAAGYFNQGMTVSTAQGARALLAAYDFSSIGAVVDVGGGIGTLIATILEARPHLRGILFDAPSVAAAARQRLDAAGLLDRCEVVGGNFFSAVPPGGDAYILSWVLLDWDDDDSLRILRNCRAVMPEHGRLLIFEAILPEGATSGDRIVGRDLSMLVMTGGRERTAAEYTALLARAGLAVTRIIPTAANRSVIEATPA